MIPQDTKRNPVCASTVMQTPSEMQIACRKFVNGSGGSSCGGGVLVVLLAVGAVEIALV